VTGCESRCLILYLAGLVIGNWVSAVGSMIDVPLAADWIYCCELCVTGEILVWFSLSGRDDRHENLTENIGLN